MQYTLHLNLLLWHLPLAGGLLHLDGPYVGDDGTPVHGEQVASSVTLTKININFKNI